MGDQGVEGEVPLEVCGGVVMCWEVRGGVWRCWEMWGGVGRCGGDVWRCWEVWGGVGRCGEVCGGVERRCELLGGGT